MKRTIINLLYKIIYFLKKEILNPYCNLMYVDGSEGNYFISITDKYSDNKHRYYISDKLADEILKNNREQKIKFIQRRINDLQSEIEISSRELKDLIE